MKRTLTGIVAASMVLGTMVPAAFAATTASTIGGQKAISVGGNVVSKPYTRVAKNGGTSTSFMGIWYLGQAVKAAGGSYTWDPSTKTFNITMPGVDASNISLPGGVGSGNTTIQVNGTTVKMVDSYAWQDPAGSKSDITTFVPIFYLGELFQAVFGGSSWNGSTFAIPAFNTVASLAISGNNTIGVGQSDTLTVTAKDAAGNPVTVAPGKVQWSATGGVINQSGQFAATAAGTYTVTASYGGQTASANVVVYGTASNLKLTANPNLVANNKSTDVITVTAVDANGNTATDYSGNVTVSAPTYGTLEDMNGNTLTPSSGLVTVAVTNGVGQLQLVSNNGALGNSDTLTATFTPPGASNTVSASTTINYVAQAATSVGVSVKSGSPATLSVNSASSSTWVNVVLNDQSGQPMASGGAYVTLTVSGPASFSSSSAQTTYTTWVPAGGANVQVFGEQGVSGTVTVTAASTGLTSGTLTIPAVVNTAAAAIKMTSSTGTDSSGNAYTLYTVTLVDSNGNVVDNSTDSVAIKDDASNSSGALYYFSGTTGLSSGVPVAGQGVTTAPTLTFSNGVAQFAVETKTVGTAPVTLTATETANSFTSTASYNYQVGTAAKIAASSSVAQSVKAGQSVQVSMQLEDANNNPVKDAGQSVTFTLANGGTTVAFANGNTSTYTATTDANGVATVTLNVGSTSGTGAITVTGSYNNTTATSTVNVINAADVVNAMAFGSNWTGTSATAGTAFAGTPSVNLTNVLNGTVNSKDEFQITSSNYNVISFATGATTWAADASGSGAYDITLGGASTFALPTINAGLAGSATITIKDLSNPSVPALTETLTSNVGTATNTPLVEYQGQAIGASNTLTVAANTPVQLTVVNVDKGGNPVPVSGTGQVVDLSDTNGGSYRLTPTGASVSDVTIPAGQSSVTVYYVNGTAQTISSGLTSAYAVLTTVTLAYSPASIVATGATATQTASPTVTGADQNGNTLTVTGGSYAITTSPTSATGVTIDTTTGVVSVAAGATTGTYTVTYTSSNGKTATANIVVS